MVKLNKIYTRTGDDGTTGLGSGERRLKSDLRVEAYGTVDEANACVGLVDTPAAALPITTSLRLPVYVGAFAKPSQALLFGRN